MSKNNRERQAEFKQRMRDSGKKQITVWVTAAQEAYIRSYLATDEQAETSDSLPGALERSEATGTDD